MTKLKKPEPLKISCTATDCKNDLHCFKATQRMPKEDRGKCRECNADLVDWKRVQSRDIKDAAHTFDALKRELIRHTFFHREMDPWAINYARRKGRTDLKTAARTRLEKYLAPANPYRDGQQTPFEKNPIFYAQHATATCCRTCLDYWHAMPKGRPLSDDEVEYCLALIEHYFDERLANVKAEGEHVPPIRA